MNKSDNPIARVSRGLSPPLTSQKSSSSAAASESSSSSYLSSNYIRYLSHLNAEEQAEDDDDYHIYWNVVTKSLLYLKREAINDDYHDQILAALFKQHFDLERLDPTPTTSIGSELLRCGYFLAAYTWLLVRLRRKGGLGILQYFQAAYSKYKISFGQAELRWYLNIEHPYTQLIITLEEGSRQHRKVSPCVRTSTCDTSLSH